MTRTSNTSSDFESSGFKAPTNPNLNTLKGKYLRAWLAGETNIGRFFHDWNSSSQLGIAVAEPHQSPTSGTIPRLYLTESKSTYGSSSSSRQTFWSCHYTSPQPDSPPQLSLVHAPGTMVSPHTPPELLLVEHTRSRDNFCHSEGALPFSDSALQSPTSQDGFYFVSDPCNPSRIRLPPSSIPLSQLQVAGHCPAIIDDICDRFSPERVCFL
jgi:hypothetical protein